jgi:hypothetical protein
MAARRAIRSAMADDDHRLVRASYWAMCNLIDDQVGRMIDALERTGSARQHARRVHVGPRRDAGRSRHLPQRTVFLRARSPCTPDRRRTSCLKPEGAKRVETLTELVDVAATFLDAAGVLPYPGMQGRSFWPLLTGRGRRPIRGALATTSTVSTITPCLGTVTLPRMPPWCGRTGTSLWPSTEKSSASSTILRSIRAKPSTAGATSNTPRRSWSFCNVSAIGWRGP